MRFGGIGGGKQKAVPLIRPLITDVVYHGAFVSTLFVAEESRKAAVTTTGHAVAVDADGTIYAADAGANWVFDPSTAQLPRRKYALEPRTGPHGGIMKFNSKAIA